MTTIKLFFIYLFFFRKKKDGRSHLFFGHALLGQREGKWLGNLSLLLATPSIPSLLILKRRPISFSLAFLSITKLNAPSDWPRALESVVDPTLGLDMCMWDKWKKKRTFFILPMLILPWIGFFSFLFLKKWVETQHRTRLSHIFFFSCLFCIEIQSVSRLTIDQR